MYLILPTFGRPFTFFRYFLQYIDVVNIKQLKARVIKLFILFCFLCLYCKLQGLTEYELETPAFYEDFPLTFIDGWLTYITLLKQCKLFSLGLGRSKVLVFRFGPKMNTKVAFNTHHTPPTNHTKLFDQFQT